MDKKKCSVCGEEKLLTEFYTQQHYSKKRGYYTYYNPSCKECDKKKAKEWNLNNLEQARALRRKYDRKPDRKKAKKKVHEELKNRGYYVEYRRQNKDKIKKYNKKRNEKNHKITKNEWETCKKYFDNSCAYCGMTNDEAKRLYNNYLHKEHVIHNGSDKIDNCIPACKSCNSSKATKKFEDWYNESNKKYSKDRYNKIIKWLNEDCKNANVGQQVA